MSRNRHGRPGAALTATALLFASLAACGSKDGDKETESDASPSASAAVTEAAKGASAFDLASAEIVNPGDAKGGTLQLGHSDDWDSPDPGNTYYAFAFNFSRLYGRTLTTFADKPGNAGLEVVPDLAEDLGKVTDDGKTITYKLKKGIKYQDGTEVKAADVKYAIERSNYAPDVLSNGPTYFKELLGTDYEGPYKDKSEAGLKTIETPDDLTLVFKLQKAFPDFDYLVTLPQTVPVPKAKDDGASYQKHIMATGPYKIDEYTPGKQMLLSRNENWDPATDPNRSQLADKIEVKLKINAADLDNKLLAGDLDLDVNGVGVASAAQGKILKDDALKQYADNPLTGFARYVAIGSKVAPFDNIHCRKAVILAADHTAMQNAYGGPTGGDIATTVMPPNLDGYVKSDVYKILDHPTGDVEAAKAELKECGKPDGFSTTLSARTDRPKEVAAAEALQQALKKINVDAKIDTHPGGQYFSSFAGSTNYAHKNNYGLMMMGWGADWPSGYGFLGQIVDGRAIKASGNSNLSEIDEKPINELFDKALETPDVADRAKLWTQIDEKVMDFAAIIPVIYEKSLMYRSPTLSNVYVHPAYGMYDYTSLGRKQ